MSAHLLSLSPPHTCRRQMHNVCLKGLSHEMDLACDDGAIFKFFRCSNDFITQTVFFSRLMWVYVDLIMLAGILPFQLSQVEYNCSLIKLDWLAACISLRVIGAVFVVFLRHWRKIWTILQPMESKDRYLKKCLKPSWPIRSKETWRR